MPTRSNQLATKQKGIRRSDAGKPERRQALLSRMDAAERERALWLETHLDALPAGYTPAHLLDVGSGRGAMAALVLLRYPKCRATLTDKIVSSSEISGLVADWDRRVEVLQWPCEERLEGQGYDLVLSIDVLEHIMDFASALSFLIRHVKRAGYLHLQTPSDYPSPNWPSRGVLKNFLLGLVGRNDPLRHVRHGLSCKTLFDLCQGRLEPIIVSEGYVVQGAVYCDFKPRTHALFRKP